MQDIVKKFVEFAWRHKTGRLTSSPCSGQSTHGGRRAQAVRRRLDRKVAETRRKVRSW